MNLAQAERAGIARRSINGASTLHRDGGEAALDRPSLGLDDTWLEEAQLRGRRVRVVLLAVYPGAAGP